jgi:large subunit ribosomal protein L18
MVKQYADLREKRRLKIRSRVRGSAARPRLNVYRSNRHLAAQLIDDEKGKVLAAVSDYGKKAAVKETKMSKTERARAVGRSLAEKARERGISQVVFDRAGYRYHGRIKALAEAVREGGVKI